MNIFGVANRPGNQGSGVISLRNPLGESPFGLDLSHPRLGGQDPVVAFWLRLGASSCEHRPRARVVVRSDAGE